MVYSLDELFLKKVQEQKIQEKYAKITLLNWNEQPIRSIEGQITSGSLNKDGKSAIRTTISLSMVSKDVNINKYTIALQSKVKIEIGLKNKIDKKYPQIIWFKQGIFIVTGFNASIGINQSTISISGKDKMCLLNGEISGTIPASTDFGQIDTYENKYQLIPKSSYTAGKYYYKYNIPNTDNTLYLLDYNTYPEQTEYYEKVSSVSTTKLNIKDIIYNMVYVFGHETKARIIINDLDIMGNELLEYRGDEPMYLIKEKDTNTNIFYDLVFDPNLKIGEKSISELEDKDFYSLNAIDNETRDLYTFQLEEDGPEYVIVKIKYGESIGYRATDLVFAGNLIAGPGETVTSVLDKIKNMFGNFEYFYDEDGNFVFQALHTYELVDFTKFTTDGTGEVYLNGSFYNNKVAYTFSDEQSETQISHSPNLSNLRNDYSLWGERANSSGGKTQIHLRYALQQKPETYTTIGDGPRGGLILKTNGTQGEIDQSQEKFIDSYNNLSDYLLAVKEKQATFEQIESDQLAIIKDKWQELEDIIIKGIKDSSNNYTTSISIRGFEDYMANSSLIDKEIVFKSNNTTRFAKNKEWFFNSSIGICAKQIAIVNEIKNKFLSIIKLAINDSLDGLKNNSLYKTNQNEDYLLELKEGNPWSLIQLLRNIDPNDTDNQNIKFLFNRCFKISNYDFDVPSGKWEETYYEAYTEVMEFYEEELNKYKKLLNKNLQDKNYENAIYNLLYIWQLKNYMLYINFFAEIERKEASNNEDDEVSEEETEYEYIKKGLVYNFGKTYEGYNEFMENNGVQSYFLNKWLYIGKFQIEILGLNYYIYKKYTEIKNCYTEIYNQQNLLNLNLTTLERKYYENQQLLINEIHDSNIPLIVDWRELIYQMSRDFYDYNENPEYDYLSLLRERNSNILQENYTTGYEPFYTDMISNWRFLYFNPLLETIEYNIKFATGNEGTDYDSETNWLSSLKYYPSQINFWFDLTEGQEGLNNYTVSRIGDRLKTVKDSAIKAIYYQDVPNILYYDEDTKKFVSNENYNINSYTVFQLGGELSNLYTISAQGKSAFNALQDLLYKFTYCTENITITSLPLYTLKPNCRVIILSDRLNLKDEFIVNKITIPLTYNGTMSISATKAVPYLGINF